MENPVAARWYLQTASQEMWSVRTLDRNISTQYFERHFKQPQILDKSENKSVPDKSEILKSPLIAEFLGFRQSTDYAETDLEKGLLTHLQEFMVELGRGFAFVAQQQHIFTDVGDFYIDLVFYNYILKADGIKLAAFAICCSISSFLVCISERCTFLVAAKISRKHVSGNPN